MKNVNRTHKNHGLTNAVKFCAKGFSEASNNMTHAPSREIKSAGKIARALARGFSEAGEFIGK